MSHEHGTRVSMESGTSSSSSGPNRDGASLNGYRHHKNGTSGDYAFPAYDPASVESSEQGAYDKQRLNGRLLSPKKSSRDRSGTRDLVRLLIAERDSKDALRALNKTTNRLEEEIQRANDAEKRLAEANERWKVVNQARLTAQAESARLTEELRLYKVQMDAAQQQITRANDMIAQSDKEKAIAEDNAEKATKMANKYKEERLVMQAREDGRRLGREEGRKEGRRIGRNEGYTAAYNRAYTEARDEVMHRLDTFLVRNGLATDEAFEEELNDIGAGYDDEYREGDDHQRETEANEAEQERVRVQAPPEQSMSMPVPSTSRQPIPMPQPHPAPESRNSSTSQRPRRSNTIFSRFRRNNFAAGDTDPNVEVNPSAPDVAAILDAGTARTYATPVPPDLTTQVNRDYERSPVPMPQPDFHPNPSEVRPISTYSRPRTPSHPHVDIPPEGYIPMQDANGIIGIPPPHELSLPPPTPGQGNSPAQGTSSLPPIASSREPMMRDFGYENRTAPSRYQRSVAGDSIISTATSNLSILTPPGTRQVSGSRLSAIPERSPYGDQSSLNMGQNDAASIHRPRSRASERIIPGEDGMGMYRADDGAGDRQFTEHRQRVADELRDPYLNRGQVRPSDNAPFSPRSGRSGSAYSSGPRRPSRLTTPAPLGASANSEYQAYTRPRVNSGASDRTGFTDPRSQRAGGSTAGSEFRRGGRPLSGVEEVGAPEINIEPPSRSESQRSQRTVMPQAPIAVVNPTYSSGVNDSYEVHMNPGSNFEYRNPLSNQPFAASGENALHFAPSVPSTTADPDMPIGFVPTEVVQPVLSPAFPPADAMPPGFIPMSASVSNAPLPIIPGGSIPSRSPFISTAGALPVPPRMPEPPQFSGSSPRLGGSDHNSTGWGDFGSWDNRSQTRSPGPLQAFGGFDAGPRPISPRPPGVGARPSTSMSHRSTFDPALNAATMPIPTVMRHDGQSSSVQGGSSPYLGGAGMSRSNTFSGNTAFVRPISPRPQRTTSFDYGADPMGIPLPPTTAPSFAAGSRTRSFGTGSENDGPVIPPAIIPSAFGDTLDPSGMPLPMSNTPSQFSQGHRRSVSASVQSHMPRAPSPAPGFGGGYSDPPYVPIPPSTGPSMAGLGRSNSYRSAVGSVGNQTPGPGVARSLSMREQMPGRSPRISFSQPGQSQFIDPSGPVVPDLVPGLPPDGLRTPYSRRLAMQPENVPVPSPGVSIYTLTTTPGRAREGMRLPGDVPYPREPASPAMSGWSANSRGRRARLPESTMGGDSPRNSRVYPRTPRNGPATFDDIPIGEPGAAPLDRPLGAFTERGNHELKRPSSRMSMTSNKSYKAFDADEYVDPAVLAAGGSSYFGN